MKLLTRQEYNLILRSLDYYDFKMTKRDKEIRENLEDKLYYNLYNPKDGVAQTDINLPALYDIKTEKDTSEDDEIKELNYSEYVIENGQYIPF